LHASIVTIKSSSALALHAGRALLKRFPEVLGIQGADLMAIYVYALAAAWFTIAMPLLRK
jgi:hypothetical protein